MSCEKTLVVFGRSNLPPWVESCGVRRLNRKIINNFLLRTEEDVIIKNVRDIITHGPNECSLVLLVQDSNPWSLKIFVIYVYILCNFAQDFVTTCETQVPPLQHRNCPELFQSCECILSEHSHVLTLGLPASCNASPTLLPVILMSTWWWDETGKSVFVGQSNWISRAYASSYWVSQVVTKACPRHAT